RPGEIPRTLASSPTLVPGGRRATVTFVRGGRVGAGASCTFSAAESRTAASASPKKLSGGPHPTPAQSQRPRAIVTPMAARTFANFSFFKVDPAWRRRDAELRAADKREFLAACEDFALDRSLRAYSTIGTRGDVDLVLLSQSPNLDDLHTFHVVLGQSGLAK